MQYFEAPQPVQANLPSVFLAGGITNCPDWQSDVVSKMADLDVAILNPRRENFPIHDPSAAEGQIRWEFGALHRADIILFWFPASPDSVQPIALYELGRYAALGKDLVVGCDHEYGRREDVIVQMALGRPDLHVFSTLSAAVDAVEAKLERL